MTNITWELKKLIPLTAVATLIAASYTLFNKNILAWHGSYIWLFCSLHVGAAVLFVGRTNNSEGLFLYSRGTSRDTIWSGKVMATAISIGITWLSVAILILGRIRFAWQDQRLNPNTIFMPADEPAFVWQTAVMYIFLFGVFNYVWVRSKLNIPRSKQTWAFAVGASIALFGLTEIPNAINWWVVPPAILLTVILMLASRTFHRQVEVS